MANAITNEFNAFQDLNLQTANQPGWRIERKFVASAAIVANTAVMWDTTNLGDADGTSADNTKTGLRVKPVDANDSPLLVGVAQNAAGAAGDEVTVVVHGVAKLRFGAVVAAGALVGTATTGYGKAGGTTPASSRNLGYALEASTDGTANAANSWVFVSPQFGAVS